MIKYTRVLITIMAMVMRGGFFLLIFPERGIISMVPKA
jgi:hypothetical protein